MLLRSLAETRFLQALRTFLTKGDARREISSMKVERSYGPIEPMRLGDFHLRATAIESTFFILGMIV